MHRPRPRFACLALGLFAIGCGGAPPPPPASGTSHDRPTTNAPAQAPSPETPDEHEGQGYGLPPADGPFPPAPAATPRDDAGDLDLAGASAESLFEQFGAAEAELLSAGTACDRACRALRSMQRASQRLCELASSPEELHRCHSARVRYQQARDRVRVSCHACAEGPPLERDSL